jgi:hypothetical protein
LIHHRLQAGFCRPCIYARARLLPTIP